MSKRLIRQYAIIVVLLMVAIFAVACNKNDNDGKVNAQGVGFGDGTASYLVLTNHDNRNQKQFQATVSPANARQTSLTWTSSNTSVATVNASGLVQAVAPGKTTIKAQLEGTEFSVEKEVDVFAPATALNYEFTTGKQELIINGLNTSGQAKLDTTVEPASAAQIVTYRSSNPNVLNVNTTSGQVTALTQSGNFSHKEEITATISGEFTEDGNAIEVPVSFDIYTRPTGVQVDIESGINELYNGGPSTKLNGTVLASTAKQDLTWSSDNTQVATVSQSGVVVAGDIGTNEPQVATVKATESIEGLVSDAKDTTFTVYQKPENITIATPFDISANTVEGEDEVTPETEIATRRFAIGSVLPLQATITPFNAKQTNVWSIAKQTTTDEEGNTVDVDTTKIATIDPTTGIFTAVGEGQVTVEVSDFFGVVSHSINFVIEKGRNLSAEIDGMKTEPTQYLVAGSNNTITPKLSGSLLTARAYHLETTTPNTVSVNEDGLLTANNQGNAELTIGAPLFIDSNGNLDDSISRENSLWHATMIDFEVIARSTDFVNTYNEDFKDLTENNIALQFDEVRLVALYKQVNEAINYSKEIDSKEATSVDNADYVALKTKTFELLEIINNQMSTRLNENFAEFKTAYDAKDTEFSTAIYDFTNEITVIIKDQTQLTQENLDVIKAKYSQISDLVVELRDLVAQGKDTIEVIDNMPNALEQYFYEMTDATTTDREVNLLPTLQEWIDNLQDILNNPTQEVAA